MNETLEDDTEPLVYGADFSQNLTMKLFVERGWVWIRNAPASTFEELLRRMDGKLIYRCDIRVDPSKNQISARPHALDFHVDSPVARTLAWRCIRAAEPSTLLVRISTVLGQLTLDVCAKLEQITVYYRSPDGTRYSVPLLSGCAPSMLTYIPFSIDPKHKARWRSGLDALERAISAVQPIRINWHDNDILIVDNRRLLHSRPTAIEAGANRWLQRVWLT